MGQNGKWALKVGRGNDVVMQDLTRKHLTQADIMADYPELSVDDIRACLAYAATREHQLSVIQSN